MELDRMSVMNPAEQLNFWPNEPHLQFVVKLHRASTLPFDFRLEAAGTLLSWALPIDIDTNPAHTHSAVRVGDHKLRYLLGERRIPDGQYGAGPMLVWDHGVFVPSPLTGKSHDRVILDGLENGLLEFELRGYKLKGRWRIQGSGKHWQLQKLPDEFASMERPDWDDLSVISGMSLDEVELSSHYCLWLEWLQFYVDRGLDSPQIVGRDQLVLDANTAAREHDIRPGIALQQSRVLCREVQVKEWEREEYLDRQTEWLDICTEYTGTIEPIDQHIAALDLSQHPDRIHISEELIRTLSNRIGLRLLHGGAHSKWIAQLAAHRSGAASAHTKPETFLSELPIEALTPVSEEHRSRLKFLGYSTIGRAAQLTLDVLKPQFGDDALTIYQAVRGRCFQPVDPRYPLNAIRECFIFGAVIEDWETIHATLDLLGTRIASRLNGRQSTTLELSVEYEESGIKPIARTFTKPIYSAVTAKAALRLLSQEIEEGAGIIALRVTLKDLRESRSQQARLLTSDARPLVNSAVNVVQKTFGDNSVRLASQIEIPRRERLLKAWRNAVGWQ
jgi:DNA ligase D-like protein (predicted 3'-phosphoesterase)